MNPWIAGLVTGLLIVRSLSRNSLTPLGIGAATITALAHAYHPWSIFFALLVVFFLAGTTVTKVKHDIKATLTYSSDGSPVSEGARTHVQVLANSLVASVLIVLHARQLKDEESCWNCTPWKAKDILVVGIIANYAAVAADTFSSELGILSPSKPRLITAPWRVVPPGTNGGVTATGLHAGLLGSFIISFTAALLLPFCEPKRTLLQVIVVGEHPWDLRSKGNFTIIMTLVGLGGSLLDSLIGALLQASVVDVRTGKVIEAPGGRKVLVRAPGSPKRTKTEAENPSVRRHGREIEVGLDILDNNAVNLLMAGSVSVAAMVGAAWFSGVELRELAGVFLRW